MISLYKFESYSTVQVQVNALTCAGGKDINYDNSFVGHYINRENCILTPIPKGIEVVDSKFEEGSYMGTLKLPVAFCDLNQVTPESKLCIHSNCTIPRAKVTRKYTRVLKPKAADFCVIPSIQGDLETALTAVFINRECGKIFFIESSHLYSTKLGWYWKAPTMCQGKPLGTSVLDINPRLKGSTIRKQEYYGFNRELFTQKNWNDFLNSTLLYCGPAIKLHTKEAFIADIMYGQLHNLVSEEELLKLLGDETNELSIEVYDSVKSMLESSDETVVGLGLKTLAELDYKKYQNTSVYLLNITHRSWRRNDMRQTASVKYMLKFLNLWDYVRENYNSHTTQEDFDTLQKVINSDFQEAIAKTQDLFIDRFPFINIDFSYSFSTSPKLEGDSNDSTEENEE